MLPCSIVGKFRLTQQVDVWAASVQGQVSSWDGVVLLALDNQEA